MIGLLVMLKKNEYLSGWELSGGLLNTLRK
jgi:hypothetical protein